MYPPWTNFSERNASSRPPAPPSWHLKVPEYPPPSRHPDHEGNTETIEKPDVDAPEDIDQYAGAKVCNKIKISV